jgi:hypothetical protein
MSFRFNHPRFPAAKIFAACILGIAFAGIAPQQLHGRSIEFSEPTIPAFGTNLNSLLSKSELPDVSGLYKPVLPGSSKFPGSLKPLPVARPRAVSPGAKNWALMSPDEMMQNIIQRDILKSPQTERGNGLDLSSPTDSYNSLLRRDTATNQFEKFNWRGSSRDTNRFDNNSDVFREYDPYGSSNKRNWLNKSQDSLSSSGKSESFWDVLKKPDYNSPEALQARKAQAERVDAFKKLLEPSVPAPTTVAVNPLPQSSSSLGALGIGTDPASSYSPAAAPAVFLGGPNTPAPPKVPVAPGQAPLPTYTPPPKPKPAFASPSRRF